MSRVPYTTKSGVQIGIRYTPQQFHEMSRDDELIQRSLLGSRRRISVRGIGHYLLLCAAAVCVALIGVFWS